MSKQAREWFEKNYCTPIDSFLSNKGLPVLNGIHEDGHQDWENIPIEKVLETYHKEQIKDKLLLSKTDAKLIRRIIKKNERSLFPGEELLHKSQIILEKIKEKFSK
jgi:hypothetical protein